MKLVDKTDKGKSGIYKITNLIDNKVYIGQSVNLWTRIKSGHLQKLLNNKGHNKHLQSAWNKYGKDNFIFEVLEYVDNHDKLNEVEAKWIKEFNSTNHKYGYNILPEVGSIIGMGVSEKTKSPIIQFNLNGIIINEFRSIYHAQKETKIYNIVTVCKGVQKTAGGYAWMYKDDYIKNGFDKEKYLNVNRMDNRIIQISPHGNFIKIWESAEEVAIEFGCSSSTIRSSCNGKTNKAIGFIWLYEEDYVKNGVSKKRVEHITNKAHGHKSVIQLTLKDEYVNKFNSIKEASEQTGINRKNISSVCRKYKNNKSAGGYKWIFFDEYKLFNNK